MCRIAGIIDFSVPLNLQKLDAMRDSMVHGGPDDAGTYIDPEWPVAIGARRLALIDLTANGHQPMSSSDELIWLAFNGEVYNFKELRLELKAKGYTFRSGTDTEVVLHAYSEWGVECFNRFNGMFGICIWDKQTNQLVLARDHAGMKPLYYFLDKSKRQLYFASEVRAFRAIDPLWDEEISWKVNFLAYGHMPDPYTTLRNVISLRKGHYLTVDLLSFETNIKCWYQPSFNYTLLDPVSARNALEEALTKAVKRHLVADAPIGLFLSGGIDSSILTILAAQFVPEHLCTLSLIFDEAEYSEKKYQDTIIQKTKGKHQSFTVTKKEFEESMPDIMRAMDQPSTDGINSYFINKYAKATGLKAVLSGIGADELFGGYDTFKRRQTTVKLRKLPAWLLGLSGKLKDDRLKRISYLQYDGMRAEHLFYRGFYTPNQIAELLDMEEKQVREILMDHPVLTKKKHDSSGEYISRLEQDFYMQNQLLKDTDYMSMWHSVEVRLPFLDRNVLDICAQTSPSVRFEPGIPKKWLIDTFKHLLPEEIWNRKKMGFTFPFHIWFKKIHALGACNHHLFSLHKQFKKGNIRWSRYWAYLLSTGQPVSFSPPEKKFLFLTLTSFSFTGGIEKFNQCFSKALWHNAIENNWQVTMYAGYGNKSDSRYFPQSGFQSFRGKKISFALAILKNMHRYDLVLAGHINISPLLVIGKWRNAKLRFAIISHGIEVWNSLSFFQKKALHYCSGILAVSHFTSRMLIDKQKVPAGKIHLFPNTLDPLFVENTTPAQISELRKRYNLADNEKVLLTVTRLASTEQYKGYDEVTQVLPSICRKFPHTKYIIGGRADEKEKARLLKLIKNLNLEDVVSLTGFIKEEELNAHFQMADIFVMPSRKEGFGIVFIEAAWLGLPVIAGNQDGSVDALLNGKLGTLVNPTDPEELRIAIEKALLHPPSPEEKIAKRKLVDINFGFNVFKQRQATLLSEKL